MSALWQTLHTAKSQTQPDRFLSATIPTTTYEAMLAAARRHPQFVLPLPRPNGGQEFFFLQWTFYEDGQSTVIFTSLEEYKLKTAWARPFVTLTHWTDLAETSGAVLMRGEITSTTPPKTNLKGLPSTASPTTERFLLSMPDAQLLLLGLQRFYHLESGDAADQEERKEVLEGFTAGSWDSSVWERLSKLAVGGLSGLM